MCTGSSLTRLRLFARRLQSMFKTETSQFKEQLATVTQWFQQWSDCEQTIALCTLLKHIDSRQARFIEQLLQDLSSTDPNLEDLEHQANNIGKRSL